MLTRKAGQELSFFSIELKFSAWLLVTELLSGRSRTRTRFCDTEVSALFSVCSLSHIWECSLSSHQVTLRLTSYAELQALEERTEAKSNYPIYENVTELASDFQDICQRGQAALCNLLYLLLNNYFACSLVKCGLWSRSFDIFRNTRSQVPLRCTKSEPTF